MKPWMVGESPVGCTPSISLMRVDWISVIPSHTGVDGFRRADDKDHMDLRGLAPKRVRTDQVSFANIIFWIIRLKASGKSVACYCLKIPE